MGFKASQITSLVVAHLKFFFGSYRVCNLHYITAIHGQVFTWVFAPSFAGHHCFGAVPEGRPLGEYSEPSLAAIGEQTTDSLCLLSNHRIGGKRSLRDRTSHDRKRRFDHQRHCFPYLLTVLMFVERMSRRVPCG